MMASYQIVVPKETLDGLRALRLWHWEGVIHRRERQTHYEQEPANEKKAKWFRDAANFHMKQVQLLNDFFPLGDYAQGDLDKKLTEKKG